MKLMDIADGADGTSVPNEVPGDLLATVGRELREPLHALAGLVELLGTTPLPDDTREMVSMVRLEVSHLGSLVDDLIDWSRLRSGGLALQVRPIALGALVSDVVSAGTNRAGSDELHIVAEISPRVSSSVLADPIRLHQVLDRLMSNAVAFTPRGRISVSVDTGDDGVVEFRMCSNRGGEGGMPALQVLDSASPSFASSSI